jgi:hypothetical protein
MSIEPILHNVAIEDWNTTQRTLSCYAQIILPQAHAEAAMAKMSRCWWAEGSSQGETAENLWAMPAFIIHESP